VHRNRVYSFNQLVFSTFLMVAVFGPFVAPLRASAEDEATIAKSLADRQANVQQSPQLGRRRRVSALSDTSRDPRFERVIDRARRFQDLHTLTFARI
jgi:hypothetical protein